MGHGVDNSPSNGFTAKVYSKCIFILIEDKNQELKVMNYGIVDKISISIRIFMDALIHLA